MSSRVVYFSRIIAINKTRKVSRRKSDKTRKNIVKDEFIENDRMSKTFRYKYTS